MIISPEEIYSEYYKQSFFKKQGFYPKELKNFDTDFFNSHKDNFEKFANLCNSSGIIYHKIFIKALIYSFGPWFDCKLLGSQKGIKCYKNYIELINNSNNSEIILSLLKSSISFIIKYCKENNLKNFDDYLYENQFLIPTLAKHYKSGAISIFLLTSVPNILDLIKNFASDVQETFFYEFTEKYEELRSRLIINKDVQIILRNLEKIINKGIVQ